MLAFQRKIIERFKILKGLAKVYVYGSIAKGNYRLDSDIDIAIVTANKKAKKLATKIANDIYLNEAKLVSLKFFTEKEFKKDLPFILEIKRGRRIV